MSDTLANPDRYSRQDVARLLKCSISYVDTLIADGRLQVQREQRRTWITAQSLRDHTRTAWSQPPLPCPIPGVSDE